MAGAICSFYTPIHQPRLLVHSGREKMLANTRQKKAYKDIDLNKSMI
jgi:hypothetical protein